MVEMRKKVCPTCEGTGYYRLISTHTKNITVYEPRQKCENCMGLGAINELHVTIRGGMKWK